MLSGLEFRVPFRTETENYMNESSSFVLCEFTLGAHRERSQSSFLPALRCMGGQHAKYKLGTVSVIVCLSPVYHSPDEEVCYVHRPSPGFICAPGTNGGGPGVLL